MTLPSVYIDFNDMLGPNSFALICRGTQEDFLEQKLTLTEGMRLTVHDSELAAIGTVGKTKPNVGWPGEGHWMIDIDPDSWTDFIPR